MSVTRCFLELSERGKTHPAEDFSKEGFMRSFSGPVTVFSPVTAYKFPLPRLWRLRFSRYTISFIFFFNGAFITVLFSSISSSTASFVFENSIPLALIILFDNQVSITSNLSFSYLLIVHVS